MLGRFSVVVNNRKYVLRIFYCNESNREMLSGRMELENQSVRSVFMLMGIREMCFGLSHSGSLVY